jgi:hypothetical protein
LIVFICYMSTNIWNVLYLSCATLFGIQLYISWYIPFIQAVSVYRLHCIQTQIVNRIIYKNTSKWKYSNWEVRWPFISCTWAYCIKDWKYEKRSEILRLQNKKYFNICRINQLDKYLFIAYYFDDYGSFDGLRKF